MYRLKHWRSYRRECMKIKGMKTSNIKKTSTKKVSMKIIISKIIQHFQVQLANIEVITSNDEKTKFPYVLVNDFKEQDVSNVATEMRELSFRVILTNSGNSIECIADGNEVLREAVLMLHRSIDVVLGIRKISSAVRNNRDIWNAEYDVVIIV